MSKKIISVILVFLGCCAVSITAFPQAELSYAEGNEEADYNEESATINVISRSEGTVITGAEAIIASDCVQTVTADSEYLEWLFGVPDEIKSAPTVELLEYFLNSPFMGQQIYSCSSIQNNIEIDFSCHEAFRELISRDDFAQVLENYAESILHGSETDEEDKAKFEKLSAQASVKLLIPEELLCSRRMNKE